MISGEVDVKAQLIKTLGELGLDAAGAIDFEELPPGDKYLAIQLPATFQLREVGPEFAMVEI